MGAAACNVNYQIDEEFGSSPALRQPKKKNFPLDRTDPVQRSSESLASSCEGS